MFRLGVVKNQATFLREVVTGRLVPIPIHLCPCSALYSPSSRLSAFTQVQSHIPDMSTTRSEASDGNVFIRLEISQYRNRDPVQAYSNIWTSPI